MKTKIRGIQHIPSIMKCGGPRQMRSQYEMLNQLAQLGREKEWLRKERKSWQERIERINERLGEIERAQASLQRQVDIKEEAARSVQDAEQAAGNEKREMVIRY